MDKNSNSQVSDLKVYVAGIPKNITKEELYNYFCYFGPIGNITLFASKDPNHQSCKVGPKKPLKGYCVVSVLDWNTFSAILAYRRHSLFGRSIYCTRYQEGNKLMRQNRLNNQKRVIFKNVPVSFDIESLRLLIERHVGKVEVLYEFKDSIDASHITTEDTYANTKAFSIMFVEKSQAEALIRATSAAIEGTIFSVEKFKPVNKKTSKLPVQKCFPASRNSDKGVKNRKEKNMMDSTTDKNTNSGKPHFVDAILESITPASRLYFQLRSHSDSIEKKPASYYRFNRVSRQAVF